MMRCFLAVELSASLQRAIGESTSPARKLLGPNIVRWVPEENIHLTLKFLGETATTSVEQIGAALQADVPRYKPFAVELRGMGAFPNVRRARVLWIGLVAPPALASLQRELDVGTVRLGYVSEEREFSPHLTIGRVRQNVSSSDLQRIREVLEGYPIQHVGILDVDAVHLYKSELLPTGSVYSKLRSVRLSGN